MFIKWFGTFLRAYGVDLLKIIAVKLSHFIHRLAQLKFANEAGTGHSETAEPINNLNAYNGNCDVIGQNLNQ